MSSDIEIARQAKPKLIGKIAEKCGIPENSLHTFGRHKAKVDLEYLDRLSDNPDTKLILVTGITPTPAGEGKTTTTVGLGDALNKIGKKATICLREPSLGPSFWHQRRRGGWRSCAGHSHGGYQPPFHW